MAYGHISLAPVSTELGRWKLEFPLDKTSDLLQIKFPTLRIELNTIGLSKNAIIPRWDFCGKLRQL